MISEAIIGTLLYADTDVTDVVGSNIFTRRAGNNQPGYYIVSNQISSVPQNQKSTAANVDEVRVQVDCYGSDSATVALLADTVRRCLEKKTATTVATMLGTVVLQGSILLNENPSYIDPARAEGLILYSQDFQFRIERTP